MSLPANIYDRDNYTTQIAHCQTGESAHSNSKLAPHLAPALAARQRGKRLSSRFGAGEQRRNWRSALSGIWQRALRSSVFSVSLW